MRNELRYLACLGQAHRQVKCQVPHVQIALHAPSPHRRTASSASSSGCGSASQFSLSMPGPLSPALAFSSSSPVPPANNKRAQNSGWHTVQDTAAEQPCPALPLSSCLALDAGLPARHCTAQCTFGPWCSERLYHRDPEWVVGGSRGGLQWLHCAHASPNALLGPTRAHRPFAGPNAASAVGRRAVQLLGCPRPAGNWERHGRVRTPLVTNWWWDQQYPTPVIAAP